MSISYMNAPASVTAHEHGNVAIPMLRWISYPCELVELVVFWPQTIAYTGAYTITKTDLNRNVTTVGSATIPNGTPAGSIIRKNFVESAQRIIFNIGEVCTLNGPGSAATSVNLVFKHIPQKLPRHPRLVNVP